MFYATVLHTIAETYRRSFEKATDGGVKMPMHLRNNGLTALHPFAGALAPSAHTVLTFYNNGWRVEICSARSVCSVVEWPS